MMEKLRIFFIETREPGVRTNQRLYRSAMVCEGLLHFLGIQTSMTRQLPGVEQHRNLVSIAYFGRRIAIHVDYVDAGLGGGGQRSEFAQHFLAEAALRARVQLKAHPLKGAGVRRR